MMQTPTLVAPRRRARRAEASTSRALQREGPRRALCTAGCSCCRRSPPTASSCSGRSSRPSSTRSTRGTASRRRSGSGSTTSRPSSATPTLLSVLGHAFQLIIFFSGDPGRARPGRRDADAATWRRAASARSRANRAVPARRSSRSSRPASPGAGCSRRTGVVNQVLSAIGLGGVTRAWLGRFRDLALPAVGVIGVWVLLGLCTVLLLVGHGKIDPALYEAAQLDGAGPVREFLSITLPSLRQEIGVCVTVTVIAALSAFDIVYISTQRRARERDDGSGPRDLPARLLQPRGRPRLGARRGADGARARLHPADSVADPESERRDDHRPAHTWLGTRAADRPDGRDAAAVRQPVHDGAAPVGDVPERARLAVAPALGQLRRRRSTPPTWARSSSRAC